MPFDVEEKITGHHEDFPIPPKIFAEVFDNELSAFQLELMRGSWIEAILHLRANKDKINIFLDWLCIAFSHPGITDELLVDLADELEILTAQLFYDAVLTDRLNIINRLMIVSTRDDLLTMFRAEDYIIFRAAIDYGYLDIAMRLLEKMRELAPDEYLNMLTADNFGAFRLAASHKDVAVRHWLFSFYPALPDTQRAILAKENLGPVKDMRKKSPRVSPEACYLPMPDSATLGCGFFDERPEGMEEPGASIYSTLSA